MTIDQLIREATAELKDNGYLHGEREANFMVGKLMGQDSAWLISHSEDPAPDNADQQLAAMVKKRLSGCPLAYILGEQPFLGWKFTSDKRALIPRPETEYLVELLVKAIKEFNLADKKFLEVGTGSGAMAIALKKYFPDSSVTASDISVDALELAEENARRLEAEVDFVESDLFTSIPQEKYDLVVANLPYVPTERLAFVTDQILDWEPMIAIEAGSDGLKYIEPFLAGLPKFLSKSGVAAIEMWHDHSETVKKLAKEFLPNHEVVVEKDLAGFERYALFLPLRP